MLAAGADGCRNEGWICITRDQGSRRVESLCYDGASALIHQRPRPAVLAIDVPIGLPPTGSRECDRLARQHLGPRRSSVFPAPIRPLLGASSWEDACARRERIEGKRISKQVYFILERIGDIDAVLRALTPRSR